MRGRGKDDKGKRPPAVETDLKETPKSVLDYLAGNRPAVEKLLEMEQTALEPTDEQMATSQKTAAKGADGLRKTFSHLDDDTLAAIATWVTVSVGRMADATGDPYMAVSALAFAWIAKQFYATADEIGDTYED